MRQQICSLSRAVRVLAFLPGQAGEVSGIVRQRETVGAKALQRRAPPALCASPALRAGEENHNASCRKAQTPKQTHARGTKLARPRCIASAMMRCRSVNICSGSKDRNSWMVICQSSSCDFGTAMAPIGRKPSPAHCLRTPQMRWC